MLQKLHKHLGSVTAPAWDEIVVVAVGSVQRREDSRLWWNGRSICRLQLVSAPAGAIAVVQRRFGHRPRVFDVDHERFWQLAIAAGKPRHQEVHRDGCFFPWRRRHISGFGMSALQHPKVLSEYIVGSLHRGHPRCLALVTRGVPYSQDLGQLPQKFVPKSAIYLQCAGKQIRLMTLC